MGIDADAENNFININGMWHATLSVSMGPAVINRPAESPHPSLRTVPYSHGRHAGAEKSWKGTLLTYTALSRLCAPYGKRSKN
jgi:intracellular multiplication protein IcmB